MRNIVKVKIDEVSGRQKQFWQCRKCNATQREESQTWGGSTQEGIGNGWCFTICDELQICQLREWNLHRGQDSFQLPMLKAPEQDLTYAIALPKCCNDVVRAG